MIFWFTGQSGAGKTTVVDGVQKARPHFVVLDGNEMRHSISLGAGFSKEERTEHNYRVARLANVLSKRGHTVLVAVIAPFNDVRREIEKIYMPIWVYLDRPSLDINEERPYEPPMFPALVLSTDEEMEELSIERCMRFIDGLVRTQ